MPNDARNPLLTAALGYAARGWRVFPLQPNSKVPFEGTRGFKDATVNPGQIHVWWKRWSRANIGCATGRGLVVMDEDTYKGADASAFVLPVTLTASTARGGQHRFFIYASDLPSKAEGVLAPGICIKATGGYVVLPPSIYQGKPYSWLDEAHYLAQLPERMAALIRGEPRAQRQTERQPSRQEANNGDYWVDQATQRARQQGRNNAGLWLAQQLVWNDCRDPDGAMIGYSHIVEDWDTPAYTEQEALATLASVRRQPRREQAKSQSAPRQQRQDIPRSAPRTHGTSALDEDDETPPHEPPPVLDLPIHQTDLGNARRFTGRHGTLVRYVAAWGKWLLWDGTRWLKDETDAVQRLGKETVAALYKEAAETDDDSERKDLAKWALRSESETRLRAMLSLAESEQGVALAGNDLDRNGWLLNARNGTVDLRTGLLLAHEPTHLLTMRAEANYDASATCDAWDRFLDQTFAGDADLIGYVQRAVGYSLTQEMGEQCAFVMHGGGANGKSTFVDTMTRLLADYAMTTPTETLMVKSGSHIPSDVARLVGARFVAASEASDGRRLDEELVKRITGGDRMAARFMNHDWFEFYPVLKLWLAVNHKPTIRGTDLGIWRRIHLIPFAVTVPPDKQDRALVKKLLAEAPGILAWAVRGCLSWQKIGLKPPQVVLDATAAYRSEMDTIGRFLEECCTVAKGAQASAKMLYEAYKLWCGENGEREQTQNRLGATLGERGYLRERDSRGAKVWRGIGLNAEPVQGSMD